MRGLLSVIMALNGTSNHPELDILAVVTVDCGLLLPPGPGPWRLYRELGEDTGSTEPSVLCCEWRGGAGTSGHLTVRQH